MKNTTFFFLFILFLWSNKLISQENSNQGIISGNIQTIGQYYQEDTLINAALPDHQYGFNGFANINYQKGDFRAVLDMRVILILLRGIQFLLMVQELGIGS